MIYIISLILNLARAEQSATIELQKIEVTGELRRPTLQWIDSSQHIQELLPEIYQKQFQAIEIELLEP